jgi:MFS family permease
MPVQEDEEQAEETSRTSEDKDFGIYQLLLFIVTQLGYFPVAASMLVTTFFEPSQNWCRHSQSSNNQSAAEKPKLEVSTEFASLLLEWGEECRQSSFQLYVSSSIMCGAVFGAFACGFFADRCGRKPIVVGEESHVLQGRLASLFRHDECALHL